MIISVTLALLLSGAPPPKSPEASVVGVVPQLSQATSLVPFFTHAGTRSVLLRPEAWKNDAHPLLELDVTDPDALARAGLDAKGPLTRALVGDVTAGCVRIANLDTYRKAVDARLARQGDVFEKMEGPVSIYGTRDPIGRVLAAYSVLGKDSCALNGHGHSVESLFPLLAKWTSKAPTAPGWTAAGKSAAPLLLVLPSGAPSGVVSVAAKEFELNLDARLKSAPFAQFAGAGPSPFGQFRSPGMAVFRGRLAPAQLPSLVQQVVRAFPNGQVFAPLAPELATLLTGNTAAVVSHVKVTNGLRTREARFFALKWALVAELTDPAKVAALLATLDPGVFKLREGTLVAAVENNVLVVSTDADARSKALAALATSSGKQAHGFEFEVDPQAVAKGLQQVPLLEAVQAPELAALVGASTELGPLLQASTSVSGWLDSGAGGHSGVATWKLDEAKFSADAGVSDGGH
ncbi:MAG: hypothetical protein U0228_33485 [Myxococcaceae bacterium]